KALLVGLVLAHARLVAAMHGFQPVILLDDVSAFLDEARREALFVVLERIGAQVFMTGVDATAFAALKGSAEEFRVGAEGIARLA
ncbi:MAG TPA: DNA replication and repair protein RecF, partial [Xanthobacteraceae bacterium]|nr:DNA replication and repair protein RecF [Xanthobacteraceae bacterium]